MPAAGFIPGPGDTMASSPLAQMGSLMAILRENQESKARVAAIGAQTQESLARSQVAQQQAALLGLQVQHEPEMQAAQLAQMQAGTGLTQAQTGASQQQTTLSQMLAPGQLSLQQGQLGLQQSQQEEFAAQARHSNALADQEELHAQQLKDAQREMNKPENKKFIGKTLFGSEGAALDFNWNTYSMPLMRELAQTQYESRYYQQRMDLMKSLGDKAEAQAGYFESKAKDAPEYQLPKLLAAHPELAKEYVDNENPVVAKFAQAVVNNPGIIKPKDANINQVVAGLMTKVINNPNLDAASKMKALMSGGMFAGIKPRMIQEPYDFQTGVQPPPHLDVDGMYQQLQGLGAAFSSTPAPTTAAPAAAQPSRVRMTDPQGRSVTVRADQIDEAKAQGYKER